MSTDHRRVVLFTTAIRSEYDLLYPVIKAVDEHSALRARVIVTGAHLSPLYGHTVSEIERDGFDCVARIESLLNSDSKAGRVKSAAVQLSALVDVFANARPDFVVAIADREEALTVAVAGAYLSIPVVHIGGGDTADDGNIDNAVRDAVTKLSHLHMVTTPRSGDRVARLGEEPWRINVVGASGLDRLLTVPELSPAQVSAAVGVDLARRPLALVIQHPIIGGAETAGREMRITLDALLGAGLTILVSYPNSDAGSQQVIAAIDEYTVAHGDRIRSYRSLTRDVFVNLLRHVDLLVGNSSAGIIEAPLLRKPVINVGPRQVGREHANNVIFVNHDVAEISAAVDRALNDEAFRDAVASVVNPYGDGRAGQRIADVLAKTEISRALIYKRSTF